MNIINFVDTIEKNVRDEAGKFVKISTVTNVYWNTLEGKTELTVDSVSRLNAGNTVIISDGVINVIENIYSLDVTNKKIIIDQNYSGLLPGAVVKKTDAFTYLNQSLFTFSKFKPKKKVKVITNPNSNLADLPEDWENGFSWITDIEYPIGENPKCYLEKKEYEISLQEDDSFKIEYCYQFTQDLKVYYNILQSFDEQGEVTAADSDFNCICDIASSYYLLALASRYAQSTDATISADTVNYQDKVNQFIKLSNEYLNKASMWLNIDVADLRKGSSSNVAASYTQEIDTVFGQDSILKF